MKTLEGEFLAGMESGKKPSEANNAKALNAVAKRNTPPLVRAYWSGYLCQFQLDLGIDSIIPAGFGCK